MSSFNKGTFPGEVPDDFDERHFQRRAPILPRVVVLLPFHKSPTTATPQDVRAVVAPSTNDLEARQSEEVKALEAEGWRVAEVCLPGDPGTVVPQIRMRATERADAIEAETEGYASIMTTRARRGW
jgi:hypothetical protein